MWLEAALPFSLWEGTSKSASSLVTDSLPRLPARETVPPGVTAGHDTPSFSALGERPAGVEPPQPDLLTSAPLSDLLLGFLYLKLGEGEAPTCSGCLGCSGWVGQRATRAADSGRAPCAELFCGHALRLGGRVVTVFCKRHATRRPYWLTPRAVQGLSLPAVEQMGDSLSWL